MFLENNNYLGHWHLEENVEDGDGVEKPVEDVEDGQVIGLLPGLRESLDNQTKAMVHQDVSGSKKSG